MSAATTYKVLFVIPNLGGGGAEKVLIQILKLIDREKFSPVLAVFDKSGVYLDEVPEDVTVYDLHKRSRYSFIPLQWRINKIVRRLGIDVVVAFVNYTNYTVLMSRVLFGWHSPVIAVLRTTLGPSLAHQPFPRVKKNIIRNVYPKAEAVVTVSEGSKRDLIRLTSIPRSKVRVIYNPVDTERIRALAREPVDIDRSGQSEIIAVGRLTVAKDYPTLLKAFKAVRETVDAHLTIVGEGEERSKLEELARRLGIDQYVAFPGFHKNPYKYIARAKLLVLSSCWEGFPNVIGEALACGTPVIATDCESGPREIITNEENGLLVPVGYEDKLAKAMLRMLEDDSLRKRFVEAGARRVEEFRVQKTVEEYESLLMEVLGGR